MRIQENPLSNNVASGAHRSQSWKTVAASMAIVLTVVISNNSLAQMSLFGVGPSSAAQTDVSQASNGVSYTWDGKLQSG